MFIDVHAHLFFLDNYEMPKDIIIVNTGLDYETNKDVLNFEHENVFKAIGCHPSSLDERTFEQIIKNKDKIIAVGEIGLDFYKYRRFEKQEEIFKKILEIAEEIKKPVIVHSRKAEYKVLEIIKNFDVKFLMHSYTGPLKLVKEFLDLGAYFSIPSLIVRSSNFQSLAKTVPLERVFFETDSPFMSPVKGRRNEPKNVILVYQEFSKIREIQLEDLVKIVKDNFRAFFGVFPREFQ